MSATKPKLKASVAGFLVCRFRAISVVFGLLFSLPFRLVTAPDEILRVHFTVFRFVLDLDFGYLFGPR